MPRRSKVNDSLPSFDLKAARDARGLNQESVATLLHTHQTTVARWERDGNMPGVARMAWDLYWIIEDAKLPKKAKGRKRDLSKSRVAADTDSNSA